MAECGSVEAQKNQEWALGEIFGDGQQRPVSAVAAERQAGPVDRAGAEVSQTGPHLDAVGEEVSAEPVPLDDDEQDTSPARKEDVNAGAKRTLLWLSSGVVLLAVLIVLAFLVLGGGPTPSATPVHKSPTTPAVVAVPTTSIPPAPQQDQAVPYSPQTDSCPGGPTSPLALTDPASDTPWVCSRAHKKAASMGRCCTSSSCATAPDPTRPAATCSTPCQSPPAG